MKKAIVLIITAFLCTSMDTQAQKPEEIISPIQVEYDSVYYATQAQLWQKEIRKDKQNEEAWENYYKASKYQLTWYRGYPVNQWNKIDEIIKEMGEAIPHSFFYRLLQSGVSHFDGEKEAEMREVMAMRPEATKYFPEYVAFLIYAGTEEELRNYCRKWYESGTYSANLLNYSYNELAGTEPGAIIFTNGDAVTYAKYILQYGKGLFTGKKTICMSMLFIPNYVERLTKELNLPDFMEEYHKTPPQERSDAFIKHVVRHSKRPVYLSMVAGNTSLKDNFYAEGLVMKYSEKSYDNLAVTKQNFEKIYLKDYLKVGFTPETYEVSAQMLNLSYIQCFQSLLRFYKDSGDQVHFQELYQLMKHIIDQCTIEGRRLDYARKVFQEFRQ